MNVNESDYYSAAHISAYNRSGSVRSASFNLSGSYLEITGDASGSSLAGGSDAVNVSSQAQELLDRIRELDVFKVIYPGNDARRNAKTLNQVEDDFLSDFNDFAGMFGAMTSAMGLDKSSSFTMGLDGVGGMTVTGSDSSAGKVQTAFNNNSTAVSRFAVMAARASLADAGYTLDGFGEAYANDPVAAIKDNIDSLKERLLGFRTTGSGGEMRYGFVREFSMTVQYASAAADYRTTAAEEAAETETA